MEQGIIHLLRRHAYVQLILLLVLILAPPFIPQPLSDNIVRVLLYLLILVSAYLVDKNSRWYIKLAIGLVGLKLVSHLLAFDQLEQIDSQLTILFFIWIAFRLVRQTMLMEANEDAIVSAITGYLLLAIAFTILMHAILKLDPYSFTYLGKALQPAQINFSFCNYYIFVTYTTLGYGDVLPVSVWAQTISKVTAVAGQIYLTINVAVLVGKYLNYKNRGDASRS